MYIINDMRSSDIPLRTFEFTFGRTSNCGTPRIIKPRNNKIRRLRTAARKLIKRFDAAATVYYGEEQLCEVDAKRSWTYVWAGIPKVSGNCFIMIDEEGNVYEAVRPDRRGTYYGAGERLGTVLDEGIKFPSFRETKEMADFAERRW